VSLPGTFFGAVARCLSEVDVAAKLDQAQRLDEAVDAGHLVPDPAEPFVAVPAGRPARPALVDPRSVPWRQPTTPAGRAALLHAVAHIEYSAVNLALDHAHRFRGLPADYYRGWTRVAREEARHFELVRDRLRALGSDYGAFPAHDELWRMAERTSGDVLDRMALVARYHEARGLDASPRLRDKLGGVGDHASAAALEVIVREEVSHVALGDRWFRHACAARSLEPAATFLALLARYDVPPPRPPFNREARLAAGFSEAELTAFARM
jgi:uncharacterized ferritin-like protein (DUF455 family)